MRLAVLTVVLCSCWENSTVVLVGPIFEVDKDSGVLEHVGLVSDADEGCDTIEDMMSIELTAAVNENADVLDNVILAEMTSEEDADSDAHAVSILAETMLSVTRPSAVDVKVGAEVESTGVIAKGLEEADGEVLLVLELAIGATAELESGIPARMLS